MYKAIFDRIHFGNWYGLKLALVMVLFFKISLINAQLPFTRGVNLPLWFQASDIRQVPFGKFTKTDFANIKSLGFDVIRIPVNLHDMTTGMPDYTIDPLFYHFMDEVVNWAEDLQVNLILDNVAFDLSIPTPVSIGEPLTKVWPQVAQHYKDRSTYIYYEVLNEPNGIDGQSWDSIQQNVITAIRSVDTIHTIIAGPVNWNNYNNLEDLSEYSDSNLIYTFHFYDPLVFTHQGASWTDPPMDSLSGVPFPYNPVTMPACPDDLSGTWVESSLNVYPDEGTEAYVKELLDIPALFKSQRKAAVFCGEIGVSMHNAGAIDRNLWHNRVRSCLEDSGIAWSIWAYTGEFGLFEEGSDELFEYDLNIPLLQALGLTVPDQQEYILRPDSTGFDIYTDFISNRITESSNKGSSVIDYYSDEQPKQADFCMLWSDASRYNTIGFDFKPDKDMSLLVDQGYMLDCWIRGNDQNIKFDIRFLDSKTVDPEDHPWRIGTTIDGTLTDWNGQWQNLKIPLKDFTELGSWDNNTWLDPIGAFDWSATDRLEIIAEHMDLTGIDIYFDAIRITNPVFTALDEDKSVPPPENDRLSVYPNPVSGISALRFKIDSPGLVDISVYSLSGQHVMTVVHANLLPGYHVVDFDINHEAACRTSAGIYLCRMVTSESIETVKIIKTTY